MAELGGLLNSTLGEPSNPRIDVEMLDYEYVRSCTEWRTVHAILDLLKSGKEGYYPDLIRFTEKKLFDLLPVKEKKKYMSMNQKTTSEEIQAAESDLGQWMSSVQATDSAISALHKKSNALLADDKNISRTSSVRGRVSKEIEEQNNRDSALQIAADPYDSVFDDLRDYINRKQLEKLFTLRRDLKVSMQSDLQRRHKANLEKIKGNESFRVSENQEALKCYSRSLAYDPQNAIVWANRAMVYIRLELFDLAEEDSSAALQLDPYYTKALSRRGLVRFKRGKYAEAMVDFQRAIELDPNSTELIRLHQQAQIKYAEVEGIDFNPPTHSTGGLLSATPRVNTNGETPWEQSISLQTVLSQMEMVLPPSHGIIILDAGRIQTLDQPADVQGEISTSFVRINVVSEDDTDEDSDGYAASEVAAAAAESHSERERTSVEGDMSLRRVAIAEDDDDDDDDENEKCEERSNGEVDTQNPTRSERERRFEEADALKEKGNASLKMGEVLAAIDAYSESLVLAPQFIPSLNNRAQAHLLLKDFDATIKDCTEVLSIDPNNKKALYRRGIAYFNTADVLSARADANTLLDMDASNEQAKKLVDKLNSFALVPDPENANSPKEADMRRVPSPPAVPELPDVLKLKSQAQTFLENGDNESVIKLLGEFLRSVDVPPFILLMENDRTSILHLLATAYGNASEFDHAIYAYDTILSIDASNARAFKKKFELSLRESQKLSWAERKKRLQSLKEEIDTAHLESLHSDVEQLRALLDTALSQCVSPQSKSIVVDTAASVNWKEQGNKAMAGKDYSAAIDCYSKAIALDPKNIAALNNRALVYLKTDQNELAELDATTVLDYDNGTSAAVVCTDSAVKKKALCRRAQARRSIGQQLLQKLDELRNGSVTSPVSSFGVCSGTDIETALEKLHGALTDVQEWLLLDPENKTAANEKRALVEWIGYSNKARDKRAAYNKVVPKQTPVKKSISSNLVLPSQVSSSGIALASSTNDLVSTLDEFGMTAVSTKKYITSISPESKSDAVDAAASSANSMSTQISTPDNPPNSKEKSICGSNRRSSGTPLASAPTEPPKTVYEFERVWRGLKSNPEKFAEYLSTFKKSTFKKVLKDSVSPDLISFMLLTLRDHVDSAQTKLRALSGFSLSSNFALTYSLLPETDIQCVRSIFESLDGGPKAKGGDLTELREVYKIF